MDRSGPPRGRVICVLGMHRSGTSLVARMLNLLGVHLGPGERVLTAGADNPKGYWEYRPFVDIDDEILARFGGRWDEPPTLPPSWPEDPRLADLRDRARRLLAEDFADAPVWGWKDPRACLTLPFWQDVIGAMDYVVSVRNPCAVIASLARREGMDGARAEWLWLRHVQAILAHTSGRTRTFVSYEDILGDRLGELRRLAAFVGQPERADDHGIREALDAFVEDKLCHHHLSMEELAADRRTSFATKGLYAALQGDLGPALDIL